LGPGRCGEDLGQALRRDLDRHFTRAAGRPGGSSRSGAGSLVVQVQRLVMSNTWSSPCREYTLRPDSCGCHIRSAPLRELGDLTGRSVRVSCQNAFWMQFRRCQTGLRADAQRTRPPRQATKAHRAGSPRCRRLMPARHATAGTLSKCMSKFRPSQSACPRSACPSSAP
jgi:hypothetical protein